MVEFSLILASTLHVGLAAEYNELHPGAKVEYNNWTVGAYYNSEEHISTFASYTWTDDNYNVFVEAGLVTGYSFVGTDVIPFVRSGVNLTDDIKLFTTPVAEQNGKSLNWGAVIGIEYKF